MLCFIFFFITDSSQEGIEFIKVTNFLKFVSKSAFFLRIFLFPWLSAKLVRIIFSRENPIRRLTFYDLKAGLDV